MERLGHLIHLTMTRGRWKPIQVSRSGPHLSHLFFADDLILFVEASIDQIKVMMECLETFCSIFRQKVSLQKSCICFLKGASHNEVSTIAQIGGIPTTSNMGRYLCTPSIHGCVTTGLFQHMLDIIQSKLESWKSKYLSLAGRQTLAQLVIATIPQYTMQSILFPQGVCKQIDKVIRRFIWGGYANSRKIHLLNWKMVIC